MPSTLTPAVMSQPRERVKVGVRIEAQLPVGSLSTMIAARPGESCLRRRLGERLGRRFERSGADIDVLDVDLVVAPIGSNPERVA